MPLVAYIGTYLGIGAYTALLSVAFWIDSTRSRDEFFGLAILAFLFWPIALLWQAFSIRRTVWRVLRALARGAFSIPRLIRAGVRVAKRTLRPPRSEKIAVPRAVIVPPEVELIRARRTGQEK